MRGRGCTSARAIRANLRSCVNAGIRGPGSRIRDPDLKANAYSVMREVRGKVNPAEMKLARQVIESIEGGNQEGLRAIIDAKVAGEEFVAAKSAAKKRNASLDDSVAPRRR